MSTSEQRAINRRDFHLSRLEDALSEALERERLAVELGAPARLRAALLSALDALPAD